MKNFIGFLLVVFLFTFSFCIATFAETDQITNTPEADQSTNVPDVDQNTVVPEVDLSTVVPQTVLLKTDTIQFDGKPLEFKTMVYKDRVYVNLRELCYALKCNIKVDNKNMTIDILKDQKSVQKPVDTDKVKIQKPVKVTLKPSNYNIRTDSINTYIESFIIDGRSYVPIRYFSEVFERKVDWLKNKISINKVPDVIIGSVNGQSLYKNDFDYLYNPEYNNLKNNSSKENPVSDADIKKLKDNCFDSIVLTTLLLQKAAKENVKLDENDYIQINSALTGNVEGTGGIEAFRSLLANYSLTFYQHSKNTKDMALINKMAANLIKDVTASEETIKKYYDEHKSEFSEPEKVKAKHILFSIKDSNTGEAYDATKKEEIKKKAEEVLTAIKAGANFDEQMNKYTEDPGIKSYPDGYTFSKGEMVKEFEDCAFSLKTGEMSNLVETQFGYHIIKLEEKIPQKQMTLDEIKADLKNYLDQNEKKQYFNNLLEKLKSESKIVNKMK